MPRDFTDQRVKWVQLLINGNNIHIMFHSLLANFFRFQGESYFINYCI